MNSPRPISAFEFDIIRTVIRKLSARHVADMANLRELARRIVMDLCPGQPVADEVIEALVAVAHEANDMPETASSKASTGGREPS